ncbi:hypothetical protein DL96DRAFT_1625896 [Flagelloscypha sp. PMI_526]|nr:hypothetical protein DL96DRAFT_1625896 [Flagelloscypha sp. PMI_526]
MSASLEQPSLESTFDAIVKECGRIRLLVVGKTGVGKTSLIKSIFKVDSLQVSQDTRGQTKIHEEIVSSQNDYFVVHDSMGYEPGDELIFNELQGFIQDRSMRESLPERIHIIWLCIRIPVAGGRVIETGTEKVIQLCKDYEIPLVIIFTQFDLLHKAVRTELVQDAIDDDEDLPSNDACTNATNKQFEDVCIRPLSDFDSTLNYVRVSTKKPFEDSLPRLVQATQLRIQGLSNQPLFDDSAPTLAGATPQGIERVPSETPFQDSPPGPGVTMQPPEITTLMLGTAQRVDPNEKILVSIKIGKRKYWKVLAASGYFPGYTLEKSLRVLHQDIVKPWNFLDPADLLMGDTFRGDIVDFVDGSMYKTDRWKRLVRSAGFAGSAAGVAGAASGPAAPIVAPVTFAAVLVTAWLYETYKTTGKHVEYLMGYIVHLIMILYRLHNDSVSVAQDDVDTAVGKWGKVAPQVQPEIRSFIQRDLKAKTNRDLVIEKISDLVEYYKAETG